MRFSTLAGTLLAVASAAQAYEIVLYGDEGWSGEEVSYVIDGQHYLPYVTLPTQRMSQLLMTSQIHRILVGMVLAIC